MITVHMKSMHEPKESYECMICSEKFAKESQLSKHTCKPYVPELSLIDCPVPSNNEQIFPFVEEVHLTKDTHEIDEFDLIPIKLTIKKPKSENTDEKIVELTRTKDNQNIDGIEILPKKNKKNKIVSKPIAEKTKSANTEITFSDEEVEELLCLNKDDQILIKLNLSI